MTIPEQDLYTVLCVADRPQAASVVERGLVAASATVGGLGEGAALIEKAVAEVAQALSALEEADVPDRLVLSRAFDEPLPADRSLVKDGLFVFIGPPAGDSSSGSAAFLIRPAFEDPKQLIDRFGGIAREIQEMAKTVQGKMEQGLARPGPEDPGRPEA